MSRTRILFRADASHELGFGHVARVCALIEEAVERGEEPVAMFGGDLAAVVRWSSDRGIDVNAKQWSTTEMLQAASDPRVRALVIDGPQLAADLVPKLGDVPVPIAILDDNGHCTYGVSTIVNHNFHATSLVAAYPGVAHRLLGRRYLMLRKDIRKFTRGSCRPMASARLRLIVSFGGSDPVGATARVVRLAPDDRPLELVVIAGPGFRDDEALAAAVAIARKTGHTVDVRRSPKIRARCSRPPMRRCAPPAARSASSPISAARRSRTRSSPTRSSRRGLRCAPG